MGKFVLKPEASGTIEPLSTRNNDVAPALGDDLDADERSEQLECITQALLAMSAFDFSTYVPVRGASDEIDDLAMATRIAQRQLQQRAISANHLQSLLTSMPNPTLLLHRDGRIAALNDPAQRSLGLALNMDFPAWLSTRTTDDMPLPLSEWREPRRATCRRDGDERHYLFSMAPLLSHFDDIDGHVIIGTDISKQVAIEQQLEAARAMAEANARARSSFLANISHEIRTPLSGILGFTELLLSEGLDGETREQVAMIDSCGQHLLGLINEVLDLSRIDADRLVLDTAPFSLPKLLRECIDGLRVSHARPDVALQLRIEGAVPALLVGDATRLKQVVFNLLGNALEFTERGSVELFATTEKTSADGPKGRDSVTVRIEVRDTGVGIDNRKLASLFEPFVQAGCALKRRHGGTGLGLAIVKRVIEAMGGQVGVESTLGRGSTFWLQLQLRRAEPGVRVSSTGDDALARCLRSMRILLVEDNPVNRKVATRFLAQVGADVTSAGNGLEALRCLQERDFDAVLMDCQMPIMDGITAVKELRAREQSQARRTPVIALTAHAFMEHRQQCLRAGMDAYLSKPIQRGELYRTLVAVTDGPADEPNGEVP